MGFIKRVIRYIKKHGLKGFIKRVFGGQPVHDITAFYAYVTDRREIPLDHSALAEKKDEPITLNWIIPEMGIGSGGHINIFRFVSYLERHGIHNKIYLMTPPTLKTDREVREFTAKHFPILDKNVELFSGTEKAGFAHGTVATSWQTAYFVRNFNNTISKFYFVQDYEPFFFARGSEYEMARNTYQFGFRGLTAGDWLRDICRGKFGMEADSFGFSYDKELYHPMEKKDQVKRVFFYARPVTPRRDFELGILALNELAQRIPDLEVVFAGWDIEGYYIPFKHRNEKIVSIDHLSELYAQCDMCLVISNTNLSLLPLEIMASNSVAVCSKGENSTWLVNESNAVLVDYDPIEIADTMEYYFNHPEKLAEIRRKGLAFAQTTSWDAEGEKVYNAVVRGIKEDLEKFQG